MCVCVCYACMCVSVIVYVCMYVCTYPCVCVPVYFVRVSLHVSVCLCEVTCFIFEEQLSSHRLVEPCCVVECSPLVRVLGSQLAASLANVLQPVSNSALSSKRDGLQNQFFLKVHEALAN